MATAQTVPIEVRFTLLSMKDNYDANPDPVRGETVRIVLGTGPDWQNPAAGRKFVTDEKGEARFTTNGLMDARWRSRNIGFTPFSMPARSEHMQIGTELEHSVPLDKETNLKCSAGCSPWISTASSAEASAARQA